MKKTTAGLTLAAVTGLGTLTATPALASGPGGDGHWPPPPPPPPGPYANCDEAAAEGVYNVPREHPRYGAHLDDDNDGIGCEDASMPMATVPAAQGHMEADGTWVQAQVDRMPAGGANTGITQEPEESNAGVLALGGGLVLAAAAGGTYMVRRRRTAD